MNKLLEKIVESDRRLNRATRSSGLFVFVIVAVFLLSFSLSLYICVSLYKNQILTEEEMSEYISLVSIPVTIILSVLCFYPLSKIYPFSIFVVSTFIIGILSLVVSSVSEMNILLNSFIESFKNSGTSFTDPNSLEKAKNILMDFISFAKTSLSSMTLTIGLIKPWRELRDNRETRY